MLAEFFASGLYRLNLFALPTLFTASAMLALGLKVLLRERNSGVSISFFIMTAVAAVWLGSYSLMYCSSSVRLAAAWARVGHFGIVLIPAAVYHFTVAALQQSGRYRLRVGLVWATCAAFLGGCIFDDSFIKRIESYAWGFYPIYGTTGILFICFFFVAMGLSLRQYWLAYRSALPGARKQRSLGLLSAFCIGYLGSLDYLPALGLALYPLGYLPVLGFVLQVNRTIRRYRLVNITPELAARQIIHAMGDALLVTDNEGVVRVANRSACEFFRWETPLEGASVAALTRAFDTDGHQLALRIVDGTLRDHEVSAFGGTATACLSSFAMRDSDNRAIAAVCMVRDVTKAKLAQRQIERHLAEQAALHELNLAATSTLEMRAVLTVLLERLADLMPAIPTTVLLLTNEQQSLRKVACHGIDEAIWRSAPEPASRQRHPVLQAKDIVWLPDFRGHAAAELDAGYLARDGFRSYLGLPLIAQNQVIGVVSFYFREQPRYSAAEVSFLRRLAGEAAVAIHSSELYEKTRRQAAALEKANRVTEDFLSVMSHELRTPLNVISGYTKLVREGIMGAINSEQKKALDRVGRHSHELLFMVNSIMNATKIEAGALTVDRSEFLLSDLLDDVKSLYDYPRAKEVRLEWYYPDDLPSLRSDSDKLKHVLQNLINNALKFTDAGAVTVRARQLGNPAAVELTVSDTGIGIPSSDLSRIFDRFRQIDSSKTRAHGGVGLGLHIVKTFTELLGGRIKVISTPGQGSTFSITLPCSKQDCADVDAAPAS